MRLLSNDGYRSPGWIQASALIVFIIDIILIIIWWPLSIGSLIFLVIINILIMLRSSRMRLIEKKKGLRVVRFWSYQLLKWNEIDYFFLQSATYGDKIPFVRMSNGRNLRFPFLLVGHRTRFLPTKIIVTPEGETTDIIKVLNDIVYKHQMK
jgi:hypothetical protein